MGINIGSFFKRIHKSIKNSFKQNLSNNKIALAVMVGVVVSSTPLYGLHIPIGVAFAFLFKLNKPIVIAATNFGNPLTTPFLIAMQAYLGEFILYQRILKIEFSKINFKYIKAFLPSLITGIIALSLILGGLTYFLTYFLVKRKRNKKNVKTKENKKDYRINKLFFWKVLYKGTPKVPSIFIHFFTFIFTVFFFFLLSSSRKATILNLKRIKGIRSTFYAYLNTFKVFYTYALCLIDGVRIFTKEDKFKVYYENKEIFSKLQDEGKGLIFLTVHLGNWDVGARLFGKQDFNLAVVRAEETKEEVQEFIQEFRNKDVEEKIRYIYSTASAFSAIEIIDALKNNEIVLMQGDRVQGQSKSVSINFMDSEISVPIGAYIIARLTNTPIAPVFVIRMGSMKYKIKICEPTYVNKTKDRNADIKEAAVKVFKNIEETVKEYPHQWFCFYPFWNEDKKNNPNELINEKNSN